MDFTTGAKPGDNFASDALDMDISLAKTTNQDVTIIVRNESRTESPQDVRDSEITARVQNELIQGDATSATSGPPELGRTEAVQEKPTLLVQAHNEASSSDDDNHTRFPAFTTPNEAGGKSEKAVKAAQVQLEINEPGPGPCGSSSDKTCPYDRSVPSHREGGSSQHTSGNHGPDELLHVHYTRMGALRIFVDMPNEVQSAKIVIRLVGNVPS